MPDVKQETGQLTIEDIAKQLFDMVQQSKPETSAIPG
jgi:hypothetical protein